ncbi:MAG: thermonuclease family protein [Gammaproteobacteria bacterium]|nr:thermonuclease family protein [Gammaproteobacteria bacterium]
MLSVISPKRASQWGALFVLWCGASGIAAAAATVCAPYLVDEWVEVDHVHDGDTFKLVDGRSVRLIGVNTPELERQGKPAERFGDEARVSLTKMLAENPQVGLRYDQERRDRYGRTLAHVYLPDRRTVEERLLADGLGAAIVVPPNDLNLDCYHAAEQTARAEKKGIWSLPRYRGLATTDPKLGPGFQVIEGKVERVSNRKRDMYLEFPGSVVARIESRDLRFFKDKWQPEQLRGKTLRVRGWMSRKEGKLQMRLQHPATVEIIK